MLTEYRNEPFTNFSFRKTGLQWKLRLHSLVRKKDGIIL